MEQVPSLPQQSGADRSSTEPPESSLLRTPRLGRKPTRIERSCLRCHQRKVRCDKQSPCASCARLGVLCSYPEPDAVVRRPHRATISDLSERLARLERIVQAMSHDSNSHDGNDQSTASIGSSPNRSGSAEGLASQALSSTGVLVNGGHSSRYFNETLLSRVLEEVHSFFFQSLLKNILSN